MCATVCAQILTICSSVSLKCLDLSRLTRTESVFWDVMECSAESTALEILSSTISNFPRATSPVSPSDTRQKRWRYELESTELLSPPMISFGLSLMTFSHAIQLQ
jgi:hypothetical protein